MLSLHANRGVLARVVLFGALGVMAPQRADAHFKITDPTTPPQPATVQSWMSEDAVGGPQKNGPCAAVPNTALGDSPGTPVANAVTVVQSGQKVTVPVTITIGHPGWFRISLVEGPSSSQTLTSLPDPQAQGGTNCTPAIMTNLVWSPTQPVLADGLPAGSTATTMQQAGAKTFQVTIPSDASCSTARPCTLQVVMVMTDHPANDCYYHHCADVAVGSTESTGGGSGTGGAAATGGAGGHGETTGSGGSSASGGTAGSGGSNDTGGTTGNGSGGNGSGGIVGSGGATGSGGSSGTGGATGSGGIGAGGSAMTGAGAAVQSGSSGCSCVIAGHSHAPSPWAFGAVGIFALVIARRRRRR